MVYGSLLTGYYEGPVLDASDIHLVLFFQEVTHLVFVAVLGCLVFLFIQYRHRQKMLKKQDKKEENEQNIKFV
ncbi:MAG: hypothetical protein ACXACW_11185 [Candidatus Hodarchaeales archaeon]